ncbi:MAG TPA: BTAD domain-containing putative transcriptional regulator [Actinomycetota bacterium]|nr:BTAD domain-containing putative transcriptional regulator [Actinomycetota bacterium]
MELGILGPLEVRDGEALVRVPGAKERALLADLVVHAGRVVSADRLVEDLWGEQPPGNPGNALQGRVSALRRALGPAGSRLVVTRPPGYLLEVDPEEVDAGRFEGLVAEATALAPAEPPRAARLLEEALGLWRGAALAEFADRPWAQAEAARLEERRLAAVEALVELRLAAGGHAGLVGELEGLVAANPTRERPRGQLMVALYRSGRQADALAVYQETRATLAEELGIDPSPELQRLHQAILLQDPSLEAAAPGRDQPRHNLPERLTSLVGRSEELREVAKLVEQHRLVTVTGPGGAGKTTLAVELARRVGGGYPDGVWLVELAPLRDPALLAEVVGATLGLLEEPPEPGTPPLVPAEELARFLRDKALLLVLDNCEHLVEACAELARRLLQAGPGLRILATSREVLGVGGEVVWPVPPLAVPDPLDEVAADPAGPGEDRAAPEVLAGYDAVRLFVERAAAADPGFALDAASAPAVAELCRRLDGLPLAIELAASRVRALPAPEIAARLEDRFRLLGGGGRASDPRQRTLRATVDWSWELLEEPDRRLWRRLAVFPGGWTVAAAEAVCGGDGLDEGEVLEGLFRLVDRSLIVRGTTPAVPRTPPVVAAGGEPVRFAMLESLRAYGAERLAEAGEAEAVTARHTAFFLELAEEAATHRTARPWLRRVRADYDNLRAALDRVMAAGDLDTALRLAGALGWYWSTDHTIEGRQRLAGVLALADGRPPTPALARLLQVVALSEVALTPTEATVAAARRSRELFERFGDRQGVAFSKLLIAWAELQRGGPGDAALRLVEEADATFAELGDAWGQAFAGHARFVFESHHHGLSERTQEAGRQALERYRALDDQFGLAQAQFTLAEMAIALGDLDAAKAGYEGAVAAARDGGPLWALMASLVRLGTLLTMEGEEARAAPLIAEAVALARRSGQRRAFGHLYNELGAVARARDDVERARQLHQEALAIVRGLIGWSVPHTLASLACAEARLGDLDAAAAHLREAAGLLLSTPQPATAALVLNGEALVALARAQPEQAARLLAAAEATHERIGTVPVGAERREMDLAGEAVRAALDPGVLAAADADGRALDPGAVLRELVASA